MLKQEFLAQLRKGLAGLPQEDIEERLNFYSELLEDQMEEGLSEEEAVAAVGPVDEIVRQIVADTPLVRIAKERIRPKRRLGVWEIVLLVLGSPVWLSLGIAAAAVALSLYVVLWSVIAALWSVFGALAVCGVAGIPACVVLAAGGSVRLGLSALAAGLVCAGLAIFLFFGCLTATKGVLILTKELALRVKNRFIGREETA